MLDADLTRIINRPQNPEEVAAGIKYRYNHAKRGAGSILPDCESECAQEVAIKQFTNPKEYANRRHAAAIAFLEGKQGALRIAKERRRFLNVSALADDSKVAERIFADRMPVESPDEEAEARLEWARAYLKEAQSLVNEAQEVLATYLSQMEEHPRAWVTDWLNGQSVPEIRKSSGIPTTKYRIGQEVFALSQVPAMRGLIKEVPIFSADIWELCNYGVPPVKRILLTPPSDRG
ncbi:MAG: hypothetical protein U0939_22370 [Pirellulales bacterium]